MNKKTKEKLNIKKGIGLVEVLVAVFIFTIILSSLILISNMYLSGAGDNLKLTQAAYLAEEGVEAVKVIRDNSWTNISDITPGQSHYLYFSTASSTWQATTTIIHTDDFIRSFILEEVKRNIDGDISDSGDIDLKTKKLTVSVSWFGKTGETTKSLKTYITDIVGE
ncbi:MAG: hypothetical protein PHN69_01320 [Candidatus Pacebacteria bacterium]|nr:hypothetical protein [Candidatus Paceibacterota bacterium]